MKIPSYAPRLVRESGKETPGSGYEPRNSANYMQEKPRPVYTPDSAYSPRGIYNLLRSLYRRARRGPRIRNRKSSCFYCGGAPLPVTHTALTRLTINQRPAVHCPNCAAA